MAWPKGTPRPKGAGRQPGSRNKRSEGIEAFARKVLESEEYRVMFEKRLIEGLLPAGVETMLYYYAYGRPVETVEISGADGAPIQVLYGSRDTTSLV